MPAGEAFRAVKFDLFTTNRLSDILKKNLLHVIWLVSTAWPATKTLGVKNQSLKIRSSSHWKFLWCVSQEISVCKKDAIWTGSTLSIDSSETFSNISMCKPDLTFNKKVNYETTKHFKSFSLHGSTNIVMFPVEIPFPLTILCRILLPKYKYLAFWFVFPWQETNQLYST